jgi:hypothetical protein
VVVVLSLCMDPSSIIIWNVRGLNGAARQAGVRNLIASSRITVLRILGPEFCNFVFLPSVGASGGIVVAWRDCLGSLWNSRIDSHSVSVQFCLSEGSPW